MSSLPKNGDTTLKSPTPGIQLSRPLIRMFRGQDSVVCASLAESRILSFLASGVAVSP